PSALIPGDALKLFPGWHVEERLTRSVVFAPAGVAHASMAIAAIAARVVRLSPCKHGTSSSLPPLPLSFPGFVSPPTRLLEQIKSAVGVAWNEIGRRGVEGDEPAVGADCGSVGAAPVPTEVSNARPERFTGSGECRGYRAIKRGSAGAPSQHRRRPHRGRVAATKRGAGGMSPPDCADPPGAASLASPCVPPCAARSRAGTWHSAVARRLSRPQERQTIRHPPPLSTLPGWRAARGAVPPAQRG